MKKRIFIGIYIIMLLICMKLAFNLIYSSIVNYRYHKGEYEVTMKPLLAFNWNEPYVAHYNQGNIYYKKANYEDAILQYKEALSHSMPQEKECSVRINLALAVIGTLPEDYDSYENIETSLETLLSAREILLEKECATETGDGHSKEAEQLKEEIDAMIRQLKQQSESENEKETQEGEGSEEEKEKKEPEDSYEADVKKTLQERQSKANRERNETMEWQEETKADYNFDLDGYIW